MTDMIADPPAVDLAALTPDTVDLDRFYTLDELQAMPGEALAELWLACPDRPFYEDALRQAVEDTFGREAVVTDLERLEVIDACLRFYTGQHPDLSDPAPRIPLARKRGRFEWFKVSDRIRQRLEAGLPLEEEPEVTVSQADRVKRLLPFVALGLTLLCVLVVFIRSAVGGEKISEADQTATLEAGLALTGTPGQTPTPTPLALDNIDRPIKAGDDLRDYYPVLLELAPTEGPPRVFPVQQREVAVAEWQFEDDPDVASAVLGLVVRPVLGIPYTTDNADFMEQLQPGDAITLRMSTGQTLGFQVSGTERVRRQAVHIFDQGRPGIVLVLLAEPAADRLVVYGDYPPVQELSALNIDTGPENLPEDTPVTFAPAAITVLGTTGELTPSTPAGWTYLLVDLQIDALEAFDTGQLTLSVSGEDGLFYSSQLIRLEAARYALFQPKSLEAGEGWQATAVFLVPADLAGPVLHLQLGEESARVNLAYAPAGSADLSVLDVLVLETRTEGSVEDPSDLVVTLRLFNPLGSPLRLGLGDVVAIFSPVEPADGFPAGPSVSVSSQNLPLTIPGGEAVDVTFRFPWNGESFAGLQVGGYRYLVQLY